MDNCSLILIFGSLLCLLFVTLILVFTDKDPILLELHALLSKVHPKANNITINQGPKSYTVNKKDITLCIKDPDGEYYNKNMLMYVSLHELAHTLCKSVGHTDEFWKIFQKLLNKASNLGYYNHSIPPVESYIKHCGSQ